VYIISIFIFVSELHCSFKFVVGLVAFFAGACSFFMTLDVLLIYCQGSDICHHKSRHCVQFRILLAKYKINLVICCDQVRVTVISL